MKIKITLGGGSDIDAVLQEILEKNAEELRPGVILHLFDPRLDSFVAKYSKTGETECGPLIVVDIVLVYDQQNQLECKWIDLETTDSYDQYGHDALLERIEELLQRSRP